MKLALPIACAVLLTVAGCRDNPAPKVMAREVPERADDFVFENNLVAGRFYGKSLEGDPTSPGLDVWVKLPGRLVADEWYAGAMEDGSYYHHDHGGKDCYKVAVSLGGGASVPYLDNRLRWPATNYRTSTILERTDDKIVFVLGYPEWEASEGVMVKLEKKVTVKADSYFIKVEDTYDFTGTDTLTVAAGFKLHGEQDTVVERLEEPGRIAIWEKASDQSVEPEDGFIGVAMIMPDADSQVFSPEQDHALLLKDIHPRQKICYEVGSCWSKGEIKDHITWFETVKQFNI